LEITNIGLVYLCLPNFETNICCSPNEPKETKRTHETFKRALDFVTNGAEDNVLSKNKRKKLLRNPNKTFLSKPDKFEKCSCGNPKVDRQNYTIIASVELQIGIITF